MKKMTKSLLMATIGIMLALTAVFPVSTVVLAADSYPSRPVRIIVGSSPGGGVDMTARLFAEKLTERLKQQVIVENHTGGGHMIASEMVAKAKPDGHTLLVITTSHNTQPLLHKLPFDPVKSFTPIALLGMGPYCLVINPSVPAKSVKELIALAKQKPGELVFGSSGLGAGPHLSIELFRMMAGIDIKIVHFRGAGPALIDAVGGHSTGAVSSSASSGPHFKSGRLRLLATTYGGTKRAYGMPDVPTMSEAGLPGYETSTWWALIGPAGLPNTVVNRLSQEIKEIMATDEVQEMYHRRGADPQFLGPAEVSAFLKRDLGVWANIVKKANIKIE